MLRHFTGTFATALVIGLLAINGAFAQTINGGDYAGANLDPADGAILNGTFTNVGSFTVQAGRTVYIAQGTVLSVSAASADIAGTINGIGRGHAGGTRSAAASAGGDGQGPGGGEGGEYGGCVHGSGGAGGAYGGPGGNGASHFGSSPVASIGGTAYGTAIGTDIATGSGGGAGASHCSDPMYGLAGIGGNGGAGIEIITTGALDVSGAILVDGRAGQPGTDNTYAGAGGGGGAGGGIRLVGASGAISGTLSARGGAGGNSGNSADSYGPYAQPGGGGGGGRIKVATALCTSLATMYECGGPAGALGAWATSATAATAGGTGSIDGGMGCDGNPAGTSAICPSPALALSAPVAGACIAPGSTTTISWTSTAVAEVRIDTSSDGGATYGTLATVDATLGSYTWNVPTSQTPSATARVRVSSVDDPALSSASGDFTMASAPTATLTADQEFLWSTTATMFPVNISASVSGGCSSTLTLTAITATEDGVAVADLSSDVAGATIGTDDRSFDLRAVVSPGRTGRLYRIDYTIGGTSQASVWVPVLAAATKAFHGPEFTSPRITLNAPSVTPLVTTSDISYTLGQTCAVKISIETLAGSPVKLLLNSQLSPAGTYAVTWDGTNSAGMAMPNGAYLVQLKGCGEKRVGVMIIDR